MFEDIRKYSLHYSILGFIVLITLMLLLLASYSSMLMMIVMIIGAGSYIGWGIVHHYMIGDLTNQIVLEYVTIAILTLVIFGISV